MKTHSRRTFFSRGVQVGAGLMSLSSVASSLAQRTSKMRFGFTSYQWGSAWDVPATIANCTKAKAFGVELRTSSNYAHGVELSLPDPQRREVKKRFADSPVKLVGIASGERFDWPERAKLDAAIESAKGHVKLSQDVGGSGVRVFPNDFQKDVPQEKTIEQISRALNILGKYAADYGQQIRLENHGSLGTSLVALRKVMDGVDQPNVRIKLNGSLQKGEDFAQGFQLVKGLLGDTLHFHELNRGDFPYQLQSDLLIDMGWEGWWLLETSSKVPDGLQALIEQRGMWEGLIAKSLSR
jgi:hypothetical protein